MHTKKTVNHIGLDTLELMKGIIHIFTMGYKHHGVNTGGIPVDYIKRFVDAYNIQYFIETGTAGGESIRAMAPMFKQCHTIEIVEYRAEGLPYPENVVLHNGDSAKLLHEISKPYLGERVLFWLDAHWSEPYESDINVTCECPLLDEIQAIQGHNALILIDDARLLFGAPPWPNDPSKWPRFMDVFKRLHDCFPLHWISVVDDYIICYPDYMRDTFRDEWRERFTERYPSEETLLKQGVKKGFEAFKKYIE